MSETGVPCPECTNRNLRGGHVSANTPAVALRCSSCGVYYAASVEEAARPITETLMTKVSRSALLAPITNINERSPQEVYAIMCARIRSSLRGD